MRVLSASIGSLPGSTHGSSARHQPLWTITSSPTFTFVTSAPAGPDDARAVAAAGVKVLGLAQLLPLGDDVERLSRAPPTRC